MTIQQWKHELQEQIAAFSVYWQLQVQEAGWPQEMNPGDWDEQFLAWQNTQVKPSKGGLWTPQP